MNSNLKGKNGERELAHILQSFGFSDARRGQQFSGANGDADVVGLPGFHIECKRVEALNLYEAMKQSKNDAKSLDFPTVIHRKNNKKWLVTMELEDWLYVISDFLKAKFGITPWLVEGDNIVTDASAADGQRTASTIDESDRGK